MKISGKPIANRRQTEGKQVENRQKMDNLFLPVKWVKDDRKYCEKAFWVIRLKVVPHAF